jgi:hypothetical protein
MRVLVEELRSEWRSLDERIAAFDGEFVHIARERRGGTSPFDDPWPRGLSTPPH